MSTDGQLLQTGAILASPGHVAPGAPQPKPKPKLLTRKKCLLGLALLLLAGYVFRSTLLCAAAKVLVVDQESETVHAVMFCGKPRLLPHAARLHKDHPQSHILIVRGRNRLEELGIVPDGAARLRRQLLSQEIPGAAIQLLSYPEWHNDWGAARCLGDWLSQNPQASVCFLCERFESRHQRRIVDTLLTSEQAERVFIRSVSNPRFDESNWWKCKEGVTTFFGCFVRLAHVCCFGDDSAERVEWDPDDYEKGLVQ